MFFMESDTIFLYRLYRTYKYGSIPRRIQAVLQANGDPTLY